MKVRMILMAAAFLALSTPTLAQVQTGDISGKVTDKTGAVVPGVIVTISGATLPQPLTATTSESGTYQFPRLPVGTYEIKYELTGFRTVVRQDVRVDLGSSATINQQLELSNVQEVVTITAATPVVEAKSTTARTTFDLQMLQRLPSARDPWVMLERVPNIAMDRVNVGGTQSGQQSGYVSRGSGSTNNKWSLDGVDITDMSATGASPIYYDFDMLQEMQVTTGGADASQQTGGVGINFVTRSGTNRLKGSWRLYNTNEKFQDDNVTADIKAAGAGSGNPIQNINDFGFEVGGPIRRDSLWYWGSYGKQDIKVGVIGFYQNTPTCRPAGVPTSDIPKVLDTQTLRDCAATDLTTLNNYNWKVTWAPIRNNKFNFQNTWAEKVRNARDASDTRPLETAYRQKAVDKTFGRFGWTTGPAPIWKASDQHVFSDRFVADIQYAHIGNNFTLTFQEPAQRDVQPTFNTLNNVWGRSFNESVFLRPTDSIDLTTSYFLPALFGGDHSFKMGYRYRTAIGETISHTGGNAVARFAGTAPNSAEFFRDGYTKYDLDTHALYVQDTLSIKRATLNLGVRWDRQTDKALPGEVPANPLIPDRMPAIQFPGLTHDVVWNDVSPRVGLTYDMFGTGRTVAKTSFATYYGQMSPGQLAGNLISIAQVSLRYPWNDANGDTFVQPAEVDFSGTPLFRSSTFNLADPTNFRSQGTLDPNVKNDRTREFIVGIQHELMRNFGFEANYVWRKYDQFQWQDRGNWDTSYFQAFTFTPPADCTARCESVTYYRPTSSQPGPFVYTNTPDRYRNYHGIEFAAVKRYSQGWMANVSFAYNDAKDYWDSPRAYEDPTNIDLLQGAEFAPESGGSGIDNVFTNAKWLFKASGLYTLPWGKVNIGGNAQYRQGYPFPQAIVVTNRGGGVDPSAGTFYLLDKLGDKRHPNLFIADLKVERSFGIRTMQIIPSIDVFNVGNSNTVLARRRGQYTFNATTGVGSTPSNANQISGIVAPRVVRFGVRMTW
jgi:hypothetical protein